MALPAPSLSHQPPPAPRVEKKPESKNVDDILKPPGRESRPERVSPMKLIHLHANQKIRDLVNILKRISLLFCNVVIISGSRHFTISKSPYNLINGLHYRIFKNLSLKYLTKNMLNFKTYS